MRVPRGAPRRHGGGGHERGLQAGGAEPERFVQRFGGFVEVRARRGESGHGAAGVGDMDEGGAGAGVSEWEDLRAGS